MSAANLSNPVSHGTERLINDGARTLEFLMRLKKIDVAKMTVREVMCLYMIIGIPGMSRTDLAKALGLNAEVNVLYTIKRLVRRGFVEDRRPESRRAVPAMLYALPAGVEFWESLKP